MCDDLLSHYVYFQINWLSVFRMRIKRKELTGVDPGVLTQYVLDSRAEGTIKAYEVGLKKIWAFGLKLKRHVFLWGDGEVCSLLMQLAKERAGESTMNRLLAWFLKPWEEGLPQRVC